MASSRIVPVVLWGKTPPTHTITSVLVARNEKTIVTGGKDGQICLWDLKFRGGSDVVAYPRILLYGHCSAITALADGAVSSTSSTVVSATKCGQLYLWDIEDGTCLHARALPGYHHTRLVLFGGGTSGTEPRLLVQGLYNNVFLVNLWTFDVLVVLQQRSSPSWLIALALFSKASEHSVLGINEDGWLKMWNIKGGDAPQVEPLDDNKQHFLGTSGAVDFCTNPFGSAMALVVCSEHWQLFDLSEGGFLLLCIIPWADDHVPWTGGCFVDRFQVLIWRRDGSAYLYQLTSRCHTQAELRSQDGIGVEPAPPDAPEAAILLSVLYGRQPSSCVRSVYTFAQGSFGLEEQRKKRLVISGDARGSIQLWTLPQQDHVMDLLVHYAELHMSLSPSTQPKGKPLEECLSIVEAHIGDAWRAPAHPLGLVDFVGVRGDALQLAVAASTGDSESRAVPVTASLYLRDQGRVVCGRADGMIIIVAVLHAAAMHLLRATGKWRTGLAHLKLIGHRGAVTALLHPHSVDPHRYENKHLISGGEDFTVRMWDSSCGVLITTFSNHGGIVRHIMCVPPSQVSRLQSALCTVADDHSVALLSLKECRCLLLAAAHVFPVSGIGWRMKDDFLLVACSDGTVYVWEIETGQLDRCINGSVAADALAQSDSFNGSGQLDIVLGNASDAVVGFALTPLSEHRSVRISTTPSSTSLSSTVGQIALSSLEVLSLRTAPCDPLAHVLLFNSTKLIEQLSVDEKQFDDILRPATPDDRRLSTPHATEAATSNSGASMQTASRGAVDRQPAAGGSAPGGSAPGPGQPQAGSADYFRRYLSGRKVLSARGGHSGEQGGQPNVRAGSPSTANPPRKDQVRAAKKFAGRSIAKPQRGRREKANFLPETGIYPQELARLLLSLLYAWGLSEQLDALCTKNLGLVQPSRPLSLGTVSRNGCLALVLPGWAFHSTSCDSAKQDQVPAWTTVDSDTVVSPYSSTVHLPVVQNPSHAHWHLSSALSTQLLLSIVAVANTLMSLTSQRSNGQNDLQTSETDESEDEDQMFQRDSIIRAGWSQVAALHCVMLPEHLGHGYQPPLLTALARRWQDSCVQVREAAQALLQAELRRIGAHGRRCLVNDWMPHLPRSQVAAGSSKTTAPLHHSQSLTSPMVDSLDLSFSSLRPQPARFDSDVLRQQAVAMVIFSIVCSEFGQVASPSRKVPKAATHAQSQTPASRAAARATASMVARKEKDLFEPQVVQMTAKALEFMLLAPASHRYPLSCATRRTAADLIGRGFNMWAGYIDTPAIVFSLLRLCVFSLSKMKGDNRSHTEHMATLRACRHALSLLALARPAEFINTIAKEVATYTPASSALAQMTNENRGATTETTIVYNSAEGLPRPTASSSSPASGTNSAGGVESDILRSCRKDILHIIELLLDKMTEDVVLQLLEVVDIILHCVDDAQLRNHGLAATFPLLSKFNMVSFCAGTKRLAVGARTGQMAIYDLRSPRCQVLTAHTCPVTAVAFSRDGRLLATYSFGDSKISFWQMSSSLFGMLSAGMRLVQSFATDPAAPLPVLQQMSTVSLVWVNQRSVILLTSNGREQKFSV